MIAPSPLTTLARPDRVSPGARMVRLPRRRRVAP